MIDALFEDMENQIDEIQSGAELDVAINDFLTTNKDQLKGLTSRRVTDLMVATLKAKNKNDIKSFIRKAKKLLAANVEERKIDAIEAKQKQAKKDMGKYTNVIPDVAKFLSIDPEELADDPALLDKYLDAITDLTKLGTKGTGKMQALIPALTKFIGKQKARKATGMNATISGYNTEIELQQHVDGVLANINSMDDLKLAAREISMVTRRAYELRDDAIQAGNQADVDAFNDFIDNYIPTKFGTNQKSQQYQGLIKQLKESVVKAIKAFTPNTSSIAPMYSKEIKEFMDWTEEDLMRLDPAQLLTYQAVKQELNNGYIPPQLYDLNNKLASLKKAESMSKGLNETVAKYNKMGKLRKGIAQRVAKLSTKYTEDSKQELLTIGKQYWDDMMGTQETRTFWRNIIHPVSKAFVEAQKGMDRDMAALTEALNGLKSAPNRWFVDKDFEGYKVTLSKLGLIMAQMDYQANTPGWDEFDGAKKNYYTEALKETNAVPKDKIKIDEKAYAELAPFMENGYLNAQKALASLSVEEMKVYKAFRDMTDNTEERVKMMMEKRGDVFAKQKDYFPRNVLTDSKSMADEQINSVLSMFGVGGGKVSTRASATQKRVQGGPKYYNFNIEEVANRHARQVNTDYQVTDQVKQVLSAMTTMINEAKMAGDIEKANTLSSIKNSVEESLKTELGSQVPFKTTFNQLITSLTGIERNLALANPTRIITEIGRAHV
jgi:hypothetical protein